MADETTRAVLSLLAEGRDVPEILRAHPTLTPMDVQQAAAEALALLETGETREARIARVRRTHPQAFAPWTPQEEARLVAAFREGARLADLARRLGRPPGAVRARLERALGPDWRGQQARPTPEA